MISIIENYLFSIKYLSSPVCQSLKFYTTSGYFDKVRPKIITYFVIRLTFCVSDEIFVNFQFKENRFNRFEDNVSGSDGGREAIVSTIFG